MKKEFCDVIKLNFAIGFLFLDLLIPPPPEQQKTWLIRDKRRDRIPIDPLNAKRDELHYTIRTGTLLPTLHFCK